ncbi:MAG: flagellar assembly protein FliW [Clostridiaceae bacterium]|nr:flagellar assembly protein FliW [Clostridiaceae bacterium]
MQLNTKHFGVIEIDEKEILYFPSGIPGFENVKKFTLLGRQENEAPFFWLQGVDDPALAFVVTDPFAINDDYFVDADDDDIKIIDAKDPERILTLAIVTIPEDITKISVNLKAPILINMDNNKGMQVIMKNETFPVKYYIMEKGNP